MIDDLTEKQSEVLEFIVEHLERHHRTPSYAEIAGHFEWSSPNAAQAHVRSLEAKQYLGRDGRHYRLERHAVRCTFVQHKNAVTAT